MSAPTACLRVLSRTHRLGPRTPILPPRAPHIRAFHSPFIALNVSHRLATPSPPTATPIYEKEDDSSSEPHLSSSGTRTYVVSEPDPSNTPYQVPSGAYPASASYVSYGATTATNHKAPHGFAGSSIPHSYTAHTVPQREGDTRGNTVVRGTETSGGRGSHKESDLTNTARSE